MSSLRIHVGASSVAIKGERVTRMKEPREEVGTEACMVGKIVKSRIKWAGHMVRMKDERSSKRSETQQQGGCRKRGRRQLRWEDSERGRGGRKVERKGQQQGAMESHYNKSSRTSE